MKRRTPNGFTLLELVISLTIFGVVAVIVYATLNLGARAAERGEARSVENQRARAALALIARHLKSAYPMMIQAEGETFVYFFGDANELTFISAAGRPETGGLEKVTYFLRERRGRRSLWVRTSAPTLPSDLVEDREGSLRQETEVLPDVEDIGWTYLTNTQNRQGGAGLGSEEWSRSWSGKKERRLPTAVRFSWRAQLGQLPREWRIEVPINVTTPPPGLLGAPQGGRGRGGLGRRGKFLNREGGE